MMQKVFALFSLHCAVYQKSIANYSYEKMYCLGECSLRFVALTIWSFILVEKVSIGSEHNSKSSSYQYTHLTGMTS